MTGWVREALLDAEVMRVVLSQTCEVLRVEDIEELRRMVKASIEAKLGTEFFER